MKSYHKLLIGVIAGVLAMAVGNNAAHAQHVKISPVYIIAETDTITDQTALKVYGAKVAETLAPYNGHYHFIARGSKIKSLDGDAPPVGVAVIEFDSSEQAYTWYTSPAYNAIKPILQAATKGRVFIVEGLAQ